METYGPVANPQGQSVLVTVEFLQGNKRTGCAMLVWYLLGHFLLIDYGKSSISGSTNECIYFGK